MIPLIRTLTEVAKRLYEFVRKGIKCMWTEGHENARSTLSHYQDYQARKPRNQEDETPNYN